MRVVKIPKGNGKFRTIYVPNKRERTRLRRLNRKLQTLAEMACNKDVVHGFMRGKSPITNARQHIGFRYTVTFDLRDFFDTVTEDMVKQWLGDDIRKMVFINGAPRQGLPTSPLVANMAAISLDAEIISQMKRACTFSVYTRYADDLTFSTSSKDAVEWLLENIPKIVFVCNFKLAEEKTHVYDSKSGMRPITGVAVGDTGIHPTRRTKRRMRAALHQMNLYSAHGIQEWCKLNPPGAKNMQPKNILEYITGERS